MSLGIRFTLSESVQLGLQVAACLGSAFEFETFRKVYSGSALELDDFLSTVTDGGFIQETSPGQYTWSHDQIQQAAYSLISSDKLRPMNLLIGIKLYCYTESNELHRVIHDIVKNMNHGIAHIERPEQRLELAQVSLHAYLYNVAVITYHS